VCLSLSAPITKKGKREEEEKNKPTNLGWRRRESTFSSYNVYLPSFYRPPFSYYLFFSFWFLLGESFSPGLY
jgi:hypothetical protein